MRSTPSVRRMWASPIPFRRDRKSDPARWQVTQVHLAVDVANAPLDAEQVERYVSRSRTQAVYEAAKSEVEQLMRAIHGGDASSSRLRWTGASSTRTTGTTRSIPSTTWSRSAIATSSRRRSRSGR